MSSAVISASGGESATTSEDSARQLRLRVLNDIRDGKVFRLPYGVLEVADDTDVADHERGDYIREVRQLDKASWVMESRSVYPYDRDGIGVQLRLTTLGELGLDHLRESLAVTA